MFIFPLVYMVNPMCLLWDNAISRPYLVKQEYLQEQEKTKSEVLEESDTDSNEN